MSRIVLAVIAVAIVAVGAWFLFRDDAGPEPDGLPADVAAPPTDEKSGQAPVMEVRPEKVPDMERLTLRSPASLLMVARMRGTWTATIEQTFLQLQGLDYRTWYTMTQTPEGPAGGGPGVGAGEGRGLPALTAPPTGAYLDDNDVDALVFDEADPNALPASFWNVVAERVRTGKMGLYFRPGVPFDLKGKTLAAHPALDHPALKALLPVETAWEIQGDPLPGIFAEKQPIAPTKAGYTHPATRLVPVEEGSRKVWYAAGVGEGFIGSKFCYPVRDLKPDAVVLLTMQAGVDLPAVIASGPGMRVLWMGTIDFGDRKTHFNREKDEFQRTLVNHWWVWLVGQAP